MHASLISTNLVLKTVWGCQTSSTSMAHYKPWCVCMGWWSTAETSHNSPWGPERYWPSPLPAMFINIVRKHLQCTLAHV